MKYNLEVEIEGQEDLVACVVDGRDIRRWEAKNEASFISEELSYTILSDLAYYALKREGKDEGMTLAKFQATCTGVSDKGGANSTDPT